MDAQGRRRAGLVGVSLYYGAIWGLAEATLGHLLHAARVPGLPGLLMVPVAVAIMGRLAVRHRRAGAVFCAGAIAASFKLFDLLVPGTDLLALSRPIQAILLEALAGAALVRLMNGFFSRSRENPSLRLRSGHCLWLPGRQSGSEPDFCEISEKSFLDTSQNGASESLRRHSVAPLRGLRSAPAPLSSDGDLRGNAHRSRERDTRKTGEEPSLKGRT